MFARNAGENAPGLRIVLRLRLHTVLIERFGPRLEGDFSGLEIFGEIPGVAWTGLPDSR